MEQHKENKKKKSLSLAWKTAIYVICFGFLLGGAAVLLGYRTFRRTLVNEMAGYAESLALTGGAMLTKAGTESLEPMSEEDPGYQMILSELNAIQRNSALEFLMITKDIDGKTVVLFDSDDREQTLKPGQEINLANHLKVEVVKEELNSGETVITETYMRDNWQLTVIVPLKNAKGDILCYISAGIPMNSIEVRGKRYLAKLSTLLMIITAVLTALAVLSTRAGLVAPILHVTKAAKEFSENAEVSAERITELKNWNSGDEIEELCHVIAGMKQEIIQYIEELRLETAEKERQKAELSMAKEIQEGMLPVDFPRRKELAVYASMCAARNVGGDFYDFYYLDDNHLVLTIADVSGKGMPAALFMAISIALLRTTMSTCRSTEKTLETVNKLLMDANATDMFVTVWMGILEISTGCMTCTNAGHEYPALMRADGSFELYKDRHGLAMAAMADIRYKSYDLTLAAGDRLFVYTDGVPEATDLQGELYGTDRLLAILNKSKEAGPDELAAAVRKDIDQFVGEAPQFDDITMLVLDYNGPEN